MNRWFFGLIFACLSAPIFAQNKVGQSSSASKASDSSKIIVGRFSAKDSDSSSDTLYIKGCKLIFESKYKDFWYTRTAPMKGIRCNSFGSGSGIYGECINYGSFGVARSGRPDWVIQWDSRNESQLESKNFFDWKVNSIEEGRKQVSLIDGHSKKFCAGENGDVAVNSVRASLDSIHGRSGLQNNSTSSAGRGGLSDLTALGSDGGYAFKCRNGFGDVFMRDAWSGYCGGAIDGDYKCFRNASDAGNFVCR